MKWEECFKIFFSFLFTARYYLHLHESGDIPSKTFSRFDCFALLKIINAWVHRSLLERSSVSIFIQFLKLWFPHNSTKHRELRKCFISFVSTLTVYQFYKEMVYGALRNKLKQTSSALSFQECARKKNFTTNHLSLIAAFHWNVEKSYYCLVTISNCVWTF